MALKLILNVIYTVGIFLCGAIVYWAWPSGQYLYIMGAIFIGGLFIILKIKLLKELRTPSKK
jgi:hypothetical protein